MDAYKNFAYSTVATAPSPASSGTSLVVFAGDGGKFPAVPFNAVIWPAGAQPLTTNAEIVRVTNRATDTLTITRAQESTSARTVVVGDQIMAAWTAKFATDLAALLSTTELAYNEFTSNVTVTATTEATANTVVTASAVSFDGATVALVEFFSPIVRTDGGAISRSVSIWLYQDGSSIGMLGQVTTPAASNADAPARLSRRLTPASGSRTYSVRAHTSAGSATVFAGTGGAGLVLPGFIRITRV